MDIFRPRWSPRTARRLYYGGVGTSPYRPENEWYLSQSCAEYPINPGDSTLLSLMTQNLVISLRTISIKYASARAVHTVIANRLYNRGAYVGVLVVWFLQECNDLDRIFSPKIRRRSKNLCC